MIEHRLLPRAVRLIAEGRIGSTRTTRAWCTSRMAKAWAGQPVRRAQPGEVRIQRALLSVSDKRGLVDFASGLAELGVELVSTGGTASALSSEESRPARSRISQVFRRSSTGASKLNPRIYAGLLAVRSSDRHVDTLNRHGIEPIDLVCVNLYPFERVSSQRGVAEGEVIENIDIGGPT